jgi:RimJ/RimL family protein N-acetyltransferase
VLTGERVVLRPFRPEDVEPLWQARLDPVMWAQTSEAPYVPEPLAAYRARHEAPSTNGDAGFAIEVDGQLVGRAGMFSFDMLARHAEVGLSLLAEHQGHGYGKDALRVLLGFGFRTRNLHRIHLQTLASNGAAVSAYLGVGFVEEGRLRDHAWVEERYEDVVLMAVLRSDWAGA